ncbi:MAG: 50S ribosomal protein L20 [Desulfohalobiaceae bacterium]
MRVKRGKTAHKKHKKYLKMAKGFRGSRSTLYRTAKEAVEHSLCDAYKDRRLKKRDYRRLWIVRINAAARQHGMSYSKLMQGLQRSGVELNRKVLADLAYSDEQAFSRLAEMAKAKVQ